MVIKGRGWDNAVKYKGEGCLCNICNKEHFCPDGCAMHYEQEHCLCVNCFLINRKKEARK